jgi:hypothetical protein
MGAYRVVRDDSLNAWDSAGVKGEDTLQRLSGPMHDLSGVWTIVGTITIGYNGRGSKPRRRLSLLSTTTDQNTHPQYRSTPLSRRQTGRRSGRPTKPNLGPTSLSPRSRR